MPSMVKAWHLPLNREFDNRSCGGNFGKEFQGESSGFNPRHSQSAAQSQNRSNKRASFYFCDHCKVRGHSKERCFKIHGHPLGWKFNYPKRAAITQVTENEDFEATT